MDDEACTPSGHCSYAGLVDFSGYKGLKARQYEKVWNDRLAELFTESGYCVSREYYYPNSRMKCDLLICTGETKIWLEVKAVWKSWFSSRRAESKQIRRSIVHICLVTGIEPILQWEI